MLAIIIIIIIVIEVTVITKLMRVQYVFVDPRSTFLRGSGLLDPRRIDAYVSVVTPPVLW